MKILYAIMHPLRFSDWCRVQTALYGRWAVFGKRREPDMVKYRALLKRLPRRRQWLYITSRSISFRGHPWLTFDLARDWSWWSFYSFRKRWYYKPNPEYEGNRE